MKPESNVGTQVVVSITMYGAEDSSCSLPLLERSQEGYLYLTEGALPKNLEDFNLIFTDLTVRRSHTSCENLFPNLLDQI